MKLYAKTTSERASKGQGGEYIDISISREDKAVIFELKAREVNGQYILDGYAINPREDGKRSEQYFKFEIAKGKK